TPELEKPIARMLELCDQVDDPVMRISVNIQIWAFFSLRGDIWRASELSERRLMRLAESVADPLVTVLANVARGMTLEDLGDYTRARVHLEQAVKLYDRKTLTPATALQDPGVLGLAYLAVTLFSLGFPDRAISMAAQATGLAREIRDPLS